MFYYSTIDKQKIRMSNEWKRWATFTNNPRSKNEHRFICSDLTRTEAKVRYESETKGHIVFSLNYRCLLNGCQSYLLRRERKREREREEKRILTKKKRTSISARDWWIRSLRISERVRWADIKKRKREERLIRRNDRSWSIWKILRNDPLNNVQKNRSWK